MMGTWLPETCRKRKMNTYEKEMRQVGYLQTATLVLYSVAHQIPNGVVSGFGEWQ
jgi:hypothetical protein